MCVTPVIGYSLFDFKAADAICREMNYTHATYWTTRNYVQGFDMSKVKYRYYPSLGISKCDRAEWKSCSYSKYSCQGNDYALRINCTGTYTKLT